MPGRRVKTAPAVKKVEELLKYWSRVRHNCAVDGQRPLSSDGWTTYSLAEELQAANSKPESRIKNRCRNRLIAGVAATSLFSVVQFFCYCSSCRDDENKAGFVVQSPDTSATEK